jgi:hypothetical protein
MRKQTFYAAICAVIMILVVSVGIIIANGEIVKTYKTNQNDGFLMVEELHWRKNGELSKEIIKFIKNGKTQTNIGVYKKGTEVVMDGQKYLKQEMDFERSKLNAPYVPKYSAIYSRDFAILISESGEKEPGKIKARSYYDKDYKALKSMESYLGDGPIDTWHYYKNGEYDYSEYDSNGDGKPDTKGLPPVPEKNIINYKMGQKR